MCQKLKPLIRQVAQKPVKADFKLNVTTKSIEEVEIEGIGDFHFVYIFNIENLQELAIHGPQNRPPIYYGYSDLKKTP